MDTFDVWYFLNESYRDSIELILCQISWKNVNSLTFYSFQQFLLDDPNFLIFLFWKLYLRIPIVRTKVNFINIPWSFGADSKTMDIFRMIIEIMSFPKTRIRISKQQKRIIHPVPSNQRKKLGNICINAITTRRYAAKISLFEITNPF